MGNAHPTAAIEALEDYKNDKELTTFTNLDSEPFDEDNSEANE